MTESDRDLQRRLSYITGESVYETGTDLDHLAERYGLIRQKDQDWDDKTPLWPSMDAGSMRIDPLKVLGSSFLVGLQQESGVPSSAPRLCSSPVHVDKLSIKFGDLRWPDFPNTEVVTAVQLWDGSEQGNLIACLALEPTVTVRAGDTLTLPSFTFSLD